MNKVKKILMYSQLKIIENIKINDYAKIYATGTIPFINGNSTR